MIASAVVATSQRAPIVVSAVAAQGTVTGKSMSSTVAGSSAPGPLRRSVMRIWLRSSSSPS